MINSIIFSIIKLVKLKFIIPKICLSQQEHLSRQQQQHLYISLIIINFKIILINHVIKQLIKLIRIP